MSTPVSSQQALFRRMFSFTVHKQCSLRLQIAKAEERGWREGGWQGEWAKWSANLVTGH